MDFGMEESWDGHRVFHFAHTLRRSIIPKKYIQDIVIVGERIISRL